jgi:uncharacterized protein with HEPN domain
VTRGDRHRLLDMQEAVGDLSTIVERGRAAWDDDKLARLAAQKLLEVLGEAAKQVGRRCSFPLPGCSVA